MKQHYIAKFLVAAFLEDQDEPAETKQKNKGWTTPTLLHVENQWRIYSDTGVAFVPLDKASPELLAVCPGAARQLEIEDSKPF